MQETFCDAVNKQLLLFNFVVVFCLLMMDTPDGGTVMSDCEITLIKELNEEGCFTVTQRSLESFYFLLAN